MARSRRDRERAECPDCGREVTVTRSGRLMAHMTLDRRTCQPPAWSERHAKPRCPDGVDPYELEER